MQAVCACRLGAFEYEPAGHGSSADAPAGQKLPLVQSSHADMPDAPCHSPAEHCAHADAPSLALNVPAAQAVAAVEPVAHADPAGQAVQSAASSRLALFEYEPDTHGSSADAPAGQ